MSSREPTTGRDADVTQPGHVRISKPEQPAPHENLTRRIEARLPLAPERVERWLKRSERFRAMCEEYDECLRALERWRAMVQTQSRQSEEFETLARSLEDEIRGFLAERAEDKD